MYKKVINVTLLVLWSVCLAGCQSPTVNPLLESVAGQTHDAVVPAHRFEWWGARHDQVCQRVAQGNVDLVFIGDSITHGWEGEGKTLWEKYYGPRNAVNLGFGGDQTQHVLWRLDHGEIDGIAPQAAVLMIGTNNSNGQDYTAEQIADGIIAICGRLRDKLPQTKILILGIFPRGEGPSSQRDKNAQASVLASRIADGKMIHYLDIGKAFLEPDGVTLTKEIMPDLLHLTPRGYQIWAEQIEPTLVLLMDE